MERTLVIVDLPMHGTAEREEGLARRGGTCPAVIHFGDTRLENRQEQIPAGLECKPGRQLLGCLHLHSLFHDGGTERHPGFVSVGSPRLILESAEAIVGHLRFPFPSGISLLNPCQIHNQVAPSQRPGRVLVRVVAISVIAAEDRQENAVPDTLLPGNLRERIPRPGRDVIRKREPGIQMRTQEIVFQAQRRKPDRS